MGPFPYFFFFLPFFISPSTLPLKDVPFIILLSTTLLYAAAEVLVLHSVCVLVICFYCRSHENCIFLAFPFCISHLKYENSWITIQLLSTLWHDSINVCFFLTTIYQKPFIFYHPWNRQNSNWESESLLLSGSLRTQVRNRRRKNTMDFSAKDLLRIALLSILTREWPCLLNRAKGKPLHGRMKAASHRIVCSSWLP